VQKIGDTWIKGNLKLWFCYVVFEGRLVTDDVVRGIAKKRRPPMFLGRKLLCLIFDVTSK